MVTVKITETYDMKTSVNKIGIIGIHTPSADLVRRLYPGLLKSHRYLRFKKCDVVGACASVLPADPLQVGVSAGDIAPEDMFNPILYKAVTNESFDTLVSRVYRSSTDVTGTGSVALDETGVSDDTFSLYYGLLAENGEWRKAMPQSGFAIKNLVPICHTLISQYGNLHPPENFEVDALDQDVKTVPDLATVNSANNTWSSTTENYTPAVTFRGRPVKMPRLPIHYGVEAWDEIPDPELVRTMVAVLVVPPARLHEFFYRLRVTWYVSFEQVCSTLTAGDGSAMAGAKAFSYAKTYSYTSAKNSLDTSCSSIDATDVELNKIMES